MYQNLRVIYNSSQIILPAPCTMCQAFVWHLLLARQMNLKILGGKKKQAGEVLSQSVSILWSLS